MKAAYSDYRRTVRSFWAQMLLNRGLILLLIFTLLCTLNPALADESNTNSAQLQQSALAEVQAVQGALKDIQNEIQAKKQIMQYAEQDQIKTLRHEIAALEKQAAFVMATELPSARQKFRTQVIQDGGELLATTIQPEALELARTLLKGNDQFNEEPVLPPTKNRTLAHVTAPPAPETQNTTTKMPNPTPAQTVASELDPAPKPSAAQNIAKADNHSKKRLQSLDLAIQRAETSIKNLDEEMIEKKKELNKHQNFAKRMLDNGKAESDPEVTRQLRQVVTLRNEIQQMEQHKQDLTLGPLQADGKRATGGLNQLIVLRETAATEDSVEQNGTESAKAETAHETSQEDPQPIWKKFLRALLNEPAPAQTAARATVPMAAPNSGAAETSAEYKAMAASAKADVLKNSLPAGSPGAFWNTASTPPTAPTSSNQKTPTKTTATAAPPKDQLTGGAASMGRSAATAEELARMSAYNNTSMNRAPQAGYGGSYTNNGYSGGVQNQYNNNPSTAQMASTMAINGAMANGMGGQMGQQMGTMAMMGMNPMGLGGMQQGGQQDGDPCPTGRRLDHSCSSIQASTQAAQGAALLLPMVGQMYVQQQGTKAQASLMTPGAQTDMTKIYNTQADLATHGANVQMGIGAANAAIAGGLLMKASMMSRSARMIQDQGPLVGRGEQSKNMSDLQLKEGVHGFLKPKGIAGKIVQRWNINENADIRTRVTANIRDPKYKTQLAERNREIAQHERNAARIASEVSNQAARELQTTANNARMTGFFNAIMAMTSFASGSQQYASATSLRKAAANFKAPPGTGVAPPIGTQSNTAKTAPADPAPITGSGEEAQSSPAAEASPSPGPDTNTLGNGFSPSPNGVLPERQQIGEFTPNPASNSNGSGSGGGGIGSGGSTAPASNPPEAEAQSAAALGGETYMADSAAGGGGGGSGGFGLGGSGSSGDGGLFGSLFGKTEAAPTGAPGAPSIAAQSGLYRPDVSLFVQVSRTMSKKGPELRPQ